VDISLDEHPAVARTDRPQPTWSVTRVAWVAVALQCAFVAGIVLNGWWYGVDFTLVAGGWSDEADLTWLFSGAPAGILPLGMLVSVVVAKMAAYD
jgi:hypothetical protein